MVKALRQNRFPYIFSYFTIRNNVQIDFSQLSSIPSARYFNAVLWNSKALSFCPLDKLPISYASWYKVLQNTFLYIL